MPATPKKPPHRTNIAEIRPLGDDNVVFNVIYKAKRFRYLFDGGDVCDVIAVSDDSDLRMALLAATNQPGIVGVAIVEEDVDTFTFESGPV
jgi:hypothetical protein